MTKPRKPAVVLQPATYRGIQRGIDQITNAVRPTLGPQPRWVALSRPHKTDLPELLDDGGLIARRIVALPDRNADMGAMLLRQLLWQLREDVGDGTATAAVLFQSIFHQAVRYITSGGNGMRLRHFLARGAEVIADEMSKMTIRLEGKENLARIANTVYYDPPLAKIMGEIFDIIGEYGRLEIRSGNSREIERDYVEGMYWSGGLHSRLMITDHTRQRVALETPAILVSNLEIDDPRHLLMLLSQVMQAKFKSLVVVCKRISEKATAVLLAASRKPDQFQAIAVKTLDTTGLEDLAFLTGAQLIVHEAGFTMGGVALQDLGHARRAWADKDFFGIVGGRVNPRQLRLRLADLRTKDEQALSPDERRALRERISKLIGGAATLWVGGATDVEIKVRKAYAERMAQALRGALLNGVLPGGGVTLLACRPALQCLCDAATDSDERAAYTILLNALEAPMRTILTNAGYDASERMAQVKLAAPGIGFDVHAGQLAEMDQVGIFDVAHVQEMAVTRAIRSAALALTVDVLVQHKDPVVSMEP